LGYANLIWVSQSQNPVGQYSVGGNIIFLLGHFGAFSVRKSLTRNQSTQNSLSPSLQLHIANVNIQKNVNFFSEIIAKFKKHRHPKVLQSQAHFLSRESQQVTHPLPVRFVFAVFRS
jgi:hypothetical protein